MEVYTSGTLESWLVPAAPPSEPSGAQCMERLSHDASAVYQRYVVTTHPAFLDYFRAVDPQAELEEVNIGSRPARRKTGAGLAGTAGDPVAVRVDADAA